MDGAAAAWSVMSGARLDGASMVGMALWCAVLRRADLRGADMTRVRMGGTDLVRAKLEDTVIEGADMHNTLVTPEDMEGVIGEAAIISWGLGYALD